MVKDGTTLGFPDWLGQGALDGSKVDASTAEGQLAKTGRWYFDSDLLQPSYRNLRDYGITTFEPLDEPTTAAAAGAPELPVPPLGLAFVATDLIDDRPNAPVVIADPPEPTRSGRDGAATWVNAEAPDEPHQFPPALPESDMITAYDCRAPEPTVEAPVPEPVSRPEEPPAPAQQHHSAADELTFDWSPPAPLPEDRHLSEEPAPELPAPEPASPESASAPDYGGDDVEAA